MRSARSNSYCHLGSNLPHHGIRHQYTDRPADDIRLTTDNPDRILSRSTLIRTGTQHRCGSQRVAPYAKQPVRSCDSSSTERFTLVSVARN